MWVMSKNRHEMYNLEAVKDIYIVGTLTDFAVRVSFIGNNMKDLTLGQYHTEAEAMIALDAVFKSLYLKESVFMMPDESKVEETSRLFERKARAANGKKTVRRGGS